MESGQLSMYCVLYYAACHLESLLASLSLCFLFIKNINFDENVYADDFFNFSWVKSACI